MASKLNRNAQCWCGSGKKYKHCHLSRHSQPPITVSDMMGRYKKVYSQRYCSHPEQHECRGDIIKAHTVPRSGTLKKIARSGKVYQFPSHLASRLSSDSVREELIGVREASAFTGFCAFHDDRVFAPLEKRPFEATPEQIFLLAYRAICRELFAKRRHTELLSGSLDADRGRDLGEQVQVQSFLSTSNLGVHSALARLEVYKAKLDRILLTGNYDEMDFYAVMTAAIPDVVSSGAIYPEFDFTGRELQDIGDTDIDGDLITFSVIASETGGAVVFAWIDEHADACSRLVKSLHRHLGGEFGNAVVRFLFTYCENTFFSPTWWDHLAPDARDSIRHRSQLGTFHTMMPDESCLLDDGREYVKWPVLGCKTTVFGR